MNRLKLTAAHAAATGMLGSLLVAMPNAVQWGFILFLVSNIGWLAFSSYHRHWALFIQQLFFLVTSAIGIWNWWKFGG